MKQVFLFTGQGAQYSRMGADLYDKVPTFKAALDACVDACTVACAGKWSLRDLLFSQEGVLHLSANQVVSINDTAYAQPALFAIEYALAKTWIASGLVPDYLIGHSVGELVAATVAGVMDLQSGMRLVEARGRLMQALPKGGAMAAVIADQETVQAAITDYLSRLPTACVNIAGVNAPKQTVISGKKEDIAAVLSYLKSTHRLVGKPLVVSHAFHSALMEPILDAFAAVANTVTYHAPAYPLVSNVTGERVTVGAQENQINAQYWVRHVRAPVYFLHGARMLLSTGCRIFIEVGPHPVLIGLVQRAAKAMSMTGTSPGVSPIVTWPSLRRGQDAMQVLTDSLHGYTQNCQAHTA